jgi:hypothetical protein
MPVGVSTATVGSGGPKAKLSILIWFGSSAAAVLNASIVLKALGNRLEARREQSFIRAGT